MHRGWQAVANLYHAWFTGTILMVLTRRGPDTAEEFLFRIFRRQHLNTFLPGLKKLGLESLPPAVACAQYHYLSNAIGGVPVEYMYESDRKAWVRYPAPRWIWYGAAICAIPSEVSRSMARGWHSHNGVTMGNPRLGFVCTKQTVDLQDSLEGYFCEYDHDLAPEERLRFTRDEEAPLFDPAKAPQLDPKVWPEERREKAHRNYAMEYVRNALPMLVEQFGPAQAAQIGSAAAYLIGLQFFEESKAALGISRTGIDGFLDFFAAMAKAQDEDVTIAGNTIRQRGWRLMRGIAPIDKAGLTMWNALWEGCLAAHDRTLRWSPQATADAEVFEWKISGR